jgi:predicted double-glycine peptidase
LSTTMLLLLLCLSEVADRESLRFEYSAEQGFDTSCGLSTLTSFMDTYWGVPCDERSLVREYFLDRLAEGDFTLSFADMKMILSAKGFSSKACQMSFGQLGKAALKYAPLIVHYDRPVGHFALVLEAGADYVVTADPAEGTILRERAYFESRWSGKVLVAALPKGSADRAKLEKALSQVQGRKALLDRAALVGAGALRW